MTSALRSLALLLPFSIPAVAQPRYAPGSYRYEMVTEMRQRQEMMGIVNETSMRLLQRLTVAIVPHHRDTLGLTIVIDSIHVDIGQPIADSALPNLAGLTVTGTMSPRGHLHSLVATVDSLADLADDFRTLFIPLPAELRVGTAWTDTSSMEVSPAGLTFGTVTVTVASRVSADTIYQGTPAWKIERTSSGLGGGTNNASGAQMIFEMVTSGAGVSFFGKNGVYLGGTGTSQSTATINVPDHNLSLPVSATGSSSVRLLGNR
jgi:hypothetical protein